MKLIASPLQLNAEFKRLIRSHSHLYWASAWAGVGSQPFEALATARKKIAQVVVGLHFYQTHPDFIQAFRTHAGVRFIKQPTGIFHPKLYLFQSDDRWELIVGSGNFTNQAFTANTEAALLISDTDEDAGSVRTSALEVINSSWKSAERFTAPELEAYRQTWKTFRLKLHSVSGQYGSKRSASGTPIFKVPVATMTWSEFIARVRKEPHAGMASRTAVLKTASDFFHTHRTFADMPVDARKYIAGLPNSFNTDALRGDWFGSMRGSGVFAAQIGANNIHISRALDRIPLAGELTKSHFDAFVREYTKAFPGNWIATATRLLALKRPDTFVCLDNQNRKRLSEAFDIVQSGIDYERYWSEIVERIRDSEWWNNPQPKNASEEAVSEGRAAFLDSLYYDRDH